MCSSLFKDLYGTPGAPKGATFWAKDPFWGPLGFSRHSIQPKWGPNKPNAPPSISCLLSGMLYVLTGIYWASISAARAPKGRFCPDFLSFVVQFWAKIVFSPNIGVWGVQIIATERPAHTSLLQPIWNHPAQGNGQKQAKKGSFGPKVPLLVALEVLGGHGGPDLVTTVTGCSACVGLMVITHFGLILGLFCMVWYVI